LRPQRDWNALFAQQARQLALDRVANDVALTRREPMQNEFFDVQLDGGLRA
jgi:hypothetical protein